MSWRGAVALAAAVALSLATFAGPALAQPARTGGVECTLPIETLRQIDGLAKALAADDARWNTQPPLARWLNAANYDQPVRPDRYRVEPRDVEAIGWMLGPQGLRQPGPGAGLLARVLLLPQLEAFASTAMQACGATAGDARLRTGLVDLARVWLGFQLAVYQRPEEAEFVKRLQASRRKTFTLLNQARAGDAVALEALRGLAAQAAANGMAIKAAALYEAVARLRDQAVATNQTPVAAALSLGAHTAQQAELAIGQAQAAANLQWLDGLMAVAPLVAAALRESRIASERMGAMHEACGFDSADLSAGERASVFECHRRWEIANPAPR